MGDVLTGRTARRQAALAEQAQNEQRARLAEEKARLKAIEDGQARVRTGGRGMLAYIDEGLTQTFGGAPGAANKVNSFATGEAT